MTKKSINVTSAMKESTKLRISPAVVEEITDRLRIEFIPLLTRALAERAIDDGRRTIQEQDLSFFDFLDWWRYLDSDLNE